MAALIFFHIGGLFTSLDDQTEDRFTLLDVFFYLKKILVLSVCLFTFYFFFIRKQEKPSSGRIPYVL